MLQRVLGYGQEKKLSRQQGLIIELFHRQGNRATNVEIADICLKYTNRISELRTLGYDIRCIEKGKSGVCTYELVEK